jgi:hypothetical protein
MISFSSLADFKMTPNEFIGQKCFRLILSNIYIIVLKYHDVILYFLLQKLFI